MNKKEKLEEATIKILQGKLIESEDKNSMLKNLIADIVKDNDFTLKQINFVLSCNSTSGWRKELTTEQIKYIINNYSNLIGSTDKQQDNNYEGRLNELIRILAVTNDTNLTDFLFKNNYSESELYILFRNAVSAYMDKKITKEQLDFIIYSKVTDEDTMDNIVKAFSEDKLSINQVKQMIKDGKTDSKNDKTKTSGNKLLNELSNQLNDVIDLAYGWEVDDDSISGVIDDDYTVDIYAKNNGNNIVLEYENKEYTDVNTLIKNVIKDVKAYTQSVIDEYGEYPNYLNNIK